MRYLLGLMQSGNIFNYTSARQYLLDSLNRRQGEQPSFSVRKWAKEMGLASHSLLVMILQGKRPLRLKHLNFLNKGLSLSPDEKLYLQALIQYENAEQSEEKNLCAIWLSELNPGLNFRTKEMDNYQVIANWVHSAILAMTDLKESFRNAKDFSKRLKNHAPVSELNAALNRLVELKLITHDDQGKLKSTYSRVTSKNDSANEGVKNYHKEVMGLASDAIQNQGVEEREFQSFSLAVSKEKIGPAKEMIRRFRSRFAKAVGSKCGDDVYQMNIQFFRLTESPTLVEDEGVDEDTNKRRKKRETSQ